MTLPVDLSRESVARWLEATPFDSHADADYLGMADAVLALLSAERRRVADIAARQAIMEFICEAFTNDEACVTVAISRALAPVEVRA